MKLSKSYLLFLLCLYLFIFEFALMQIAPTFGYWDELYALLFFPLMLIKKTNILRDKIVKKINIALCLLLLVGILSSFIYNYQPLPAVLQDIVLNLKFFLGIGTTCLLFRRINLEKYKNKLRFHIIFITWLLSFFMISDKLLHIFPVYEVRYGFKSEQLFFGHPTGLASVAFLLLIMLTLVYQKKKDLLTLFMLLALEIMTLRLKAIAVAMLYIYIFFMVMVLNKKIGWKQIIPAIIPIIMIGYSTFSAYFFSSKTMEMARGALLYKSFQIAKDFFPIGAGFGTYGSAPSATWYSPLYRMYGLNTVWGLSEGNAFYVSDSFWPMIIGQFGYLGLIVYAIIVFLLFKQIQKLYVVDKKYFLASMGALLYLMVSSIAESAFVNPLSLPLAFVIGISLVQYNKYKIEDLNRNKIQS